MKNDEKWTNTKPLDPGPILPRELHDDSAAAALFAAAGTAQRDFPEKRHAVLHCCCVPLGATALKFHLARFDEWVQI